MPRQRAKSTASSTTSTVRGNNSIRDADHGQEMGSMYDYLAKIILLGPSGCGKSCLLHRFVKGDWRVLSSQTIGVEFASKIVKVGSPGQQRRRIKLQLWDTAGTERFRSVSRSYYRGAAGAILVYDICNQRTFADLGTFLGDARALASPQMSVVCVGNKVDLVDPQTSNLAKEQQRGENLMDDDMDSIMGSLPRGPTLGSQLHATMPTQGRAVSEGLATSWASQNRISAAMEVSALSGEGVEEVFNKLARIILTKIELGEVDPGDPMSGIQYGDSNYYEDGTSSIKSAGGLTSDGYGGSTRRRRGRKSGWGSVFRVDRPGSSSGGGGKCC
ncbi:related to GTPase Rab4, small G protein superfamily [Ramularia collo-cygni]|uniref:Related to GTPase Rab4, small G protein superfamily n=1 Tax=Ramularia collo-cygni TaxID=112498 RepID=A0A2D3VDV5_9PEZI|nr:related to GTPase Rab4, small G protein superfamily [Ramularia collo-cygni]CZT25290.1 related to GTPase Rab4, small G protein superfamily [Ramularia collo-cygni]